VGAAGGHRQRVGVLAAGERPVVDHVVDPGGHAERGHHRGGGVVHVDRTVEGAPEGSAPNAGDFAISTVLVEVAASVTTADSVLMGYGIEQLATPEEQADILGRVMAYLLS
jgi:hypothetical protein